MAVILFTYPLIAQDSNFATVYFYRVKEVNKLDSRSPQVFIDDKEFFKMHQNNFIGFRVPTGKYGLRMKRKQSELLLNAEAGKTYFIRVSETVAGYHYEEALTLMPAEQGAYQMRDMSPIPEKAIQFRSYVPLLERPKQ